MRPLKQGLSWGFPLSPPLWVPVGTEAGAQGVMGGQGMCQLASERDTPTTWAARWWGWGGLGVWDTQGTCPGHTGTPGHPTELALLPVLGTVASSAVCLALACLVGTFHGAPCCLTWELPLAFFACFSPSLSVFNILTGTANTLRLSTPRWAPVLAGTRQRRGICHGARARGGRQGDSRWP